MKRNNFHTSDNPVPKVPEKYMKCKLSVGLRNKCQQSNSLLIPIATSTTLKSTLLSITKVNILNKLLRVLFPIRDAVYQYRI